MSSKNLLSSLWKVHQNRSTLLPAGCAQRICRYVNFLGATEAFRPAAAIAPMGWNGLSRAKFYLRHGFNFYFSNDNVCQQSKEV